MSCRKLRGSWRLLVTYLWPIVLLPLPLLWKTLEARCAYGVLIMAVYWLTEAIPIPVTGFLPLVIFPIMGVVGVKDLAKHYIKDTNLVFMGGLIMAVSLEKCGLHKRLGLTILKIIGTSPRRLLSGIMLSTWVLSMLISNTATTAMMIPVVNAILVQITSSKTVLYDVNVNSSNNTEKDAESQGLVEPSTNGDVKSTPDINLEEVQMVEPAASPDKQELRKESCSMLTETTNNGVLNRQFNKMLCLSVALAANIGGTATLTGSGTNLVLYDTADDLYSQYNKTSPINFATWLPYGIPSSALCVIMAWFYLQLMFLGVRQTFSCKTSSKETSSEYIIRAVIKSEYDELGKITFAEICNIVLFTLLLVLWMTRDPGFMPGWVNLLPEKRYVTDSVPVFLILVFMFTIPSREVSLKSHLPTQFSRLLEWPLVSRKAPWGPILTLGGGFAMAEACKVSGLTQLVSSQLSAVKDAPPVSLLFLVIYSCILLTQIAPNIPSTVLTLPLVVDLAQQANLPPIQLMFPANLAASYAFTLPVSTPPNAIVFSYGYVTSIDMAKSGFVLSLLCGLVLALGAVTWGPLVVNMDILDTHITHLINHTATNSSLDNLIH